MTLGKLLYEPTPEELADACALLRQARDAVDQFWERYSDKLACGGVAIGVVRGKLRQMLALDDTFDQATKE